MAKEPKKEKLYIFTIGSDEYPVTKTQLELFTKIVGKLKLDGQKIIWNHTLRVEVK